MRVLVIEDDKKIAAFVEKGLKEAGFAVDVAQDGLDGLHLGLSETYHAAIVDIMLPGIDGLTLIEKLREKKINTPIIILSARHTVDDRIQGLQKGGDDYLVKPFLFSELLARIQALIRRSSRVADPSALEVGELKIDLLSREVHRQHESISLQAREFALLEYLMRNSGKIVSKTAILENVYDYSFDPQTNVVDVLVCRLRNKVDKDYDSKMIHTVRGMGYVLKEK
ncbi:MAG: response regulator transcription factor [Deltaproteobacteria bacterium]|jgi:two-component system, OmpR family, response regulator|nr:response regulator transcription factor [Deltaproteobacteria bacterium]